MSKRISEQRLYNSAVYYLERYEASAAKVRRVLERKLQRAERAGDEVPPEALKWINNVIHKLKQQNFLSDTRYAESQVRQLSRAGKSARFMRGKLLEAGIAAETVAALLADSAETELDRARIFVRKKRLGPWHPAAIRAEKAKKDLAALARAGFAYDIARAALETDAEEGNEDIYHEDFKDTF